MKRASALSAFALGLLLAGTSAFAQLEWKHIEVTAPMGSAQQKLVVSFPFKNAGQQPVVIESVQSFCGCTTVALAKTRFAPGEAGEIVATYVPGPRMGTQRNIITVETNRAAGDKTVLTVSAEIPVVAKLERPFLVWKEGESHETKTLNIATDGAEVVEGISVKDVDAALDAQVVRVDEKSFRLHVTPKSGGVSSAVVLEAAVAGNQKKRLSAYVRVR